MVSPASSPLLDHSPDPTTTSEDCSHTDEIFFCELSQVTSSSLDSSSSISAASGSDTSSTHSRRTLPTDIANGANQSPVQPKCKHYPATFVGGKHRSFNSSWYEKYAWIEYSIERDAIFCFPCRFFLGKASGKEEVFTKMGYRDWKHATGRSGVLQIHDGSCSHKEAMVGWTEFMKNVQHGLCIGNRLDSARSIKIKENRHYFGVIADIILFCAKQNLALRGHREGDQSLNRGNFIEMLHLIGKVDEVVAARLKSGPRNATYTSHAIQNTILHILGNMVRQKICNAVREAEVFSILVDETKDCSKKEQLSINVRYLDDTGTIQEHFLTYVEAASVNAESLTQYIVETLVSFQLELSSIVSQGYDGASVMSGSCKGVQQRLRVVAPHAIYVHCYAHTLNLALVDCVKHLPTAREFFCLLERLYVFISTTKAHVLFLDKQKVLHPDKRPIELQRLCETRWTARCNSVNAVCQTFDSLVATLSEIAEGDPDPDKAVTARGLLHQVKSISFLISLVSFDQILSSTKHLSDQLQSSHVDLATAVDLVKSTRSALQEYRTDEKWDKVFKYVIDLADMHDIATESHARKRKPPQHLDDSVVFESTGSREPTSTSVSNTLKITFYFPTLDTFLAELNNRFDDKNLSIMTGIQACHPKCHNFLDIVALQVLIDVYELDGSNLLSEVNVAKRTLSGKGLETTNDVFSTLMPLKDAFPTLLKVVRIALTIAVSTATCERSFSTLKLVKSYLRSTMGEQRLADLASISIEKEISNTIIIDEVINEFVAIDKNRRIQLM